MSRIALQHPLQLTVLGEPPPIVDGEHGAGGCERFVIRASSGHRARPAAISAAIDSRCSVAVVCMSICGKSALHSAESYFVSGTFFVAIYDEKAVSPVSGSACFRDLTPPLSLRNIFSENSRPLHLYSVTGIRGGPLSGVCAPWS